MSRKYNKAKTHYKIRCYTKKGALSHEEYFASFDKARKRRTEWGLSIGLRPEPSSDFPYYPTIWFKKDDRWERIGGY